MGSSSACLCIWPTKESIFHWTERRSSLTARPGRCSPSILLQHQIGILKKKKIFVFDSRGDVHVTRVSEWVFVKHSWCCRCRWVFMACNLTVNHTGRDEGQRTQASSLTRRTWTIFNRNIRGNLIHIGRMFESGVEKKNKHRARRLIWWWQRWLSTCGDADDSVQLDLDFHHRPHMSSPWPVP